MRILKVLAILIIVTGCSSKSNKVGEGSDNVPFAETGKELKDVNFSYDSYSLDTTAKSILQANAAWLKENPARKVQIEGHCDERGTIQYNIVLGANRARASQDYLRVLGIEASRMSTVSYGEELPLDDGHNEAAWAKNRRDHFVIN